MVKKILILLMSIGLISSITSFRLAKNSLVTEKTNIKEAVQMKVNAIRKSAIPGYNKIYADTAEINVKFDQEGMYGGFKPIQIKDKKMVSDILTMVGKSTLITDESKINNMSGMAAKNNNLTLFSKDGSKKEMIFAFDDPAFAVGYLEIDGKKYDPGFSFCRYMRDFAEYRKFNTNIDKQVVELFKKYNWTVDYGINTVKETLPTNLKHEAGEYPVKIYWAYNNELLKSIGLDYSSYLGKTVDADIYRLREPLPSYMKPRMNARGIVIKYKGEIIGAYIDSGRHDSFACSLDRKSFETITNKKWENWIDGYINYKNKLEMKLSKMKPEDVIKLYYDAMNKHDEKTQFACMTRRSICIYLAVNMDNNKLINTGFKDGYSDAYQNVKAAKLLKITGSGIQNPKGIIEYAAVVDLKFVKDITSSSGKQTRFVILKKESTKSGWRVQSVGTGP